MKLKIILNYALKMLLLTGIITITLVGLIMKLDVLEVASGDSILGMSFMALINKKEEV